MKKKRHKLNAAGEMHRSYFSLSSFAMAGGTKPKSYFCCEENLTTAGIAQDTISPSKKKQESGFSSS